MLLKRVIGYAIVNGGEGQSSIRHPFWFLVKRWAGHASAFMFIDRA
jgi:hypothetical protein